MAGRPKKEIDYNLVADLASIQCTQQEIANILDISVRTLQKDEQFLRIYKKGMEFGKKSLRREMYKKAMNGNVTMLIWLSKQYLGMREPKQEINLDTNREVIEQIQELTDKL